MDNELQIRIARALWDRAQKANEAIGIPFRTWDNAPLPSRNALLDYAGVVVTALGLEEKRRVRRIGGTLTENFIVEERNWMTSWEPIGEEILTEKQISPIQELAEKFATPTPEEALAVELMKVWGKNDPSSSVAQYPFSYVATFADCAKAALAWSRKYLAEEVRIHATGYPYSVDYSDGITDAANIVEGNFPPARRESNE